MKDEETLPIGALRRRVYSVKDGHEINLTQEPLHTGDRLVVTLEGDRNSLAAALSSEGTAEERVDDPLVVADLLPSALSAYDASAVDVKPFSSADWLKRMAPVGDLRSARIDADRWVGVVLPVSRVAPDASKPDEASPPPPRAGPVDFRVSYFARVNLAGKFTWPGAILESSSQFTTTRHSEASQIRVLADQAPGK